MSTLAPNRHDARVRRFAQYVVVGAVGIAINEGTLFLSTAYLGVSYVGGGALGRVLSVLFNYVVNDQWTWGSHGDGGAGRWVLRGGKYVATRLVGMAIGLTTLVVLVEFGGVHYLLANLVAIGAGVAWGFLASELWVWGAHESSDLDVAAVRRRAASVLSRVDTNTWIVLLVSLALFVVLSAYTVSLFRSFWSTGADLGAYVHAFATTLDGSGFLQQGKYRINHPGGSYWGAHFSLTVLGFLVPFAVHQSPVTLLVVKSFVIAAGVPVFWLVARDHVESDNVAVLLTVSYALNPFLWTAAIYDFQEQTLLPVLVIGAYYAYRKERYLPFLGLFALALLTNEFVIYVAAGFLGGLAVAGLRTGRLREEATVFAAAGGLLVATKALATYVIGRYSRFSGIPTDRLADPIVAAVAGDGATPVRIPLTDVLATLLGEPLLAVDSLLINWELKLLFFGLLGLPVMYLPLADEPAVGALVPYLGLAWILADNPAYYHFGAHYSLYVLPFLYVGAARSFGWVSSRISRQRMASLTTGAVGVCIVATLVGGVLVTGLGYQMVPANDDHTETLEEAIDAVPENASLVTQNTVYPHVATRPNATFVMDDEYFERYQRRYGEVQPRYILIDTRLDTRPKDWALPVHQAYSDEFGDEYGLYRYQDGIFVFKRGYDGPTTGITRAEYTVDTRRYRPSRSVIAGIDFDDVAADETRNAENVTWKGPWTIDHATLPPGTYTATFRVNATAPDGTGTTDRRPPGSTPTRQSAGSQYVGVSSADEGLVATRAVNRTGTWTNVTVAFTLDRSGVVDFHGFEAGDRSIRVEWIEVREVRVS